MDIRVNVFMMFSSLIISDCHVGRAVWRVLGRSKKLIRMLAVITREIAELRSKTLIITSSSAPAPSNKTFTFISDSSKESSRAAWTALGLNLTILVSSLSDVVWTSIWYIMDSTKLVPDYLNNNQLINLLSHLEPGRFVGLPKPGRQRHSVSPLAAISHISLVPHLT